MSSEVTGRAPAAQAQVGQARCVSAAYCFLVSPVAGCSMFGCVVFTSTLFSPALNMREPNIRRIASTAASTTPISTELSARLSRVSKGLSGMISPMSPSRRTYNNPKALGFRERRQTPHNALPLQAALDRRAHPRSSYCSTARRRTTSSWRLSSSSWASAVGSSAGSLGGFWRGVFNSTSANQRSGPRLVLI